MSRFQFRFRREEKENITKTAWPELVGKDAEVATTTINKEKPELKIQIIPENSFISHNTVERRVRIFVDRQGRVVNIPRIG